MTMDFERAEFNAAIAGAIKFSSRSFTEVVNGQMLSVAIKAMRHTRKVPATIIRSQLGQTALPSNFDRKSFTAGGQAVSFTRKSVQGKNRFTGKSVAWAIVQARHKKTYGHIMPDKHAKRMADKLIKARVKASGFVKSGWVPIIRTMFRVVKGSDRRSSSGTLREGRLKGRPKGSVIPARTARGLAEAVFEHSANNNERRALDAATVGLRKGMSEAAQDMVRHVAEKFRKMDRRYSAR